MKIFNTLQELWGYCLFCPICQQSDRNITINMGPEAIVTDLVWEKENEQLYLTCNVLIKKLEHNIQFDINCLDNSLKITFISEKKSNKNVIQSPKPYLYVNFFGDCKRCESSTHVTSSDMEISILDKKISNIGITQESIYFLKPKDKYHVTFNYTHNLMYITRCIIDRDGYILDENSIFKFPIVNLDLTNQEKCVNKIKTILIFS